MFFRKNRELRSATPQIKVSTVNLGDGILPRSEQPFKGNKGEIPGAQKGKSTQNPNVQKEERFRVSSSVVGSMGHGLAKMGQAYIPKAKQGHEIYPCRKPQPLIPRVASLKLTSLPKTPHAEEKSLNSSNPGESLQKFPHITESPQYRKRKQREPAGTQSEMVASLSLMESKGSGGGFQWWKRQARGGSGDVLKEPERSLSLCDKEGPSLESQGGQKPSISPNGMEVQGEDGSDTKHRKESSSSL